MPKKILFIIKSAPYGTNCSQESLDILLAASQFEYEISVLFLGDGILHLTKNQNGKIINNKNFWKTLLALPLYDIHHIYTDNNALSDRGLINTSLILELKQLDQKEISFLIHQQDIIFNF